MSIEEAARIFGRIAAGFEETCMKCLDMNSGVVLLAVTEQMYSGLDGESQHLKPTYDDDPFFEEPGEWYHRGDAYKAWKRGITPPRTGSMLGLPPRPDNVPNLFIDGTFYGQINAYRRKDELVIDPGNGAGPDIVEKYGKEILLMGPTAVEYFNETYLLPDIDKFFKDSGYK